MNKLKRKHIVLGAILIIVAIVLAVVIGIFIKIKNTFLIEFPELEGSPIEGEWYQVTPDDAIASDGSEWHGIFRKGSENKVIVYFFGGGVSITGETSEGGTDFFATTMMGQDFVLEVQLMKIHLRIGHLSLFLMHPVIFMQVQENITIQKMEKKKWFIIMVITIILPI